jgi:hypothetical protein
MKDLPSLNRQKAEAEVDRFILDAEAVNMMINFQKKKAEDPDFKVPDVNRDEGLFSFQNFIFLYLAYVAFTSVPNIFRSWVVSKEEAGEWQGSGISLIDEWIANNPVVKKAASDVSDAVSQAVTNNAEQVSNAMSAVAPSPETLQAVSDTVQSVVNAVN